jgi:hypothetical protein
MLAQKRGLRKRVYLEVLRFQGIDEELYLIEILLLKSGDISFIQYAQSANYPRP